MTVAPLLEEVQVGLIAYVQLVRTMPQSDAIREYLVAVAEAHPVEVTTQHQRERVGGTVTCADVHYPFLVGVFQSGCHVGSVANAVGTSPDRGVYC